MSAAQTCLPYCRSNVGARFTEQRSRIKFYSALTARLATPAGLHQHLAPRAGADAGPPDHCSPPVSDGQGASSKRSPGGGPGTEVQQGHGRGRCDLGHGTMLGIVPAKLTTQHCVVLSFCLFLQTKQHACGFVRRGSESPGVDAPYLYDGFPIESYACLIVWLLLQAMADPWSLTTLRGSCSPAQACGTTQTMTSCSSAERCGRCGGVGCWN